MSPSGTGTERLVTTIEVLSPANKTGDGYEDFRRKQELLAEKGIHLVEIDLLKQGKRRWRDERVDQADYVMTVLRAGSSLANVWVAALGEALPAIPCPFTCSGCGGAAAFGAYYAGVFGEEWAWGAVGVAGGKHAGSSLCQTAQLYAVHFSTSRKNQSKLPTLVPLC